MTALRRPDNAARPGTEDAGRATGSSPRSDENEGWAVFSYLIAGMIFYGGLGWLIARWTHLSILFPLGMLTGLVLGIVLILYRYGKA